MVRYNIDFSEFMCGLVKSSQYLFLFLIIVKNQTMLTNNPTNHNIKAWNRRERGGRREAKYEQLCGPLRSPRLIFLQCIPNKEINHVIFYGEIVLL